MSDNIIVIDNKAIELHNNWLGVQSVVINKQIVSKKYAFAGTKHEFTLSEDGKDVPYCLTTKVSSKTHILRANQIVFDFIRDGEIIKENILINLVILQRKETNQHKVAGMKFLKEYEIKEAIRELDRALAIDGKDPHIYFYLACCYSVLEKTKDGFDNIKLAIENDLNDKELILNHELLAFIRMQDGFEVFMDANFSNYDSSSFEEK